MTEMRHVSCVAYERDQRSLRYDNVEHPLAFQVSTNREEQVDVAVEKIITAGFKMININCGCPSRTVTGSGSGSALMSNLPLLKNLLEHFQKAIQGRVPLTLKIRAGFKEKNALDVARLAEDCGVAALMIHPRTQPEGFTGKLDFELVRNVKASINIPVIFSGSVNNFERAKKTYELTGVDGFMVGRALWGAPWKMKEIKAHAEGTDFSINTSEMLTYAYKHFILNLEHYGERNGFNIFKKQVAQYIRSVENAAEWRKNLLTTATAQDMREALQKLLALNS
jgi:tRNA-dihydrouridine synthase B